jgi:hypothetical protein
LEVSRVHARGCGHSDACDRANVVAFGVLNAVLLRPLDVSEPQNLYQIRPKAWTSFKLVTTSYPAFEDFRQRNRTFSEMAAFNGYARARRAGVMR